MEPMDEGGAERPAPGGEPITYGEIGTLNTQELLQAGVAAGNIHRHSGGETEVLDLPEASKQHLNEHMAKVEELELRRTMRSLVVPVIDSEVRALLRQMGEPITLFGEREMERRERLKKLLATMSEDQAQALAEAAETAQLPAVPMAAPKELFYTEGTEDLKTARLKIAQWSLQHASARIAAQKQEKENYDKDAEDEAIGRLEGRLRSVVMQTSEVGDERPVVGAHFSTDGQLLATASWSGTVKVWSLPACTTKLSFKAHGDRLTGVAWHPTATAATAAAPSGAVALASGAVDRTARLWSADGKLLRTLEGHTDRLARISFHPMGSHLATASFDQTWRLWDVETGACVVEQEGHSRPVYAVAFQGDGALAVSGGLDGYGRVWDVRTGRSVMVLEGHVKGVLAADFSPNGFLVATGSEDHTARVWDLRKKGTLAVLPGHNSLLSQVRFDRAGGGRYLLTSGYDAVSKLWCGRKFKLTKTLAGHEGKVMASDVSPAGDDLIATGGYDRTLKLWAPEEGALGGQAADVEMEG